MANFLEPVLRDWSTSLKKMAISKQQSLPVPVFLISGSDPDSLNPDSDPVFLANPDLEVLMIKKNNS
jgi:hypothetical protein